MQTNVIWYFWLEVIGMYERILVRYGDLTLKGKNKKIFVNRVNDLIREKVNNKNVKYEKDHDRLYIVLNGENHEDRQYCYCDFLHLNLLVSDYRTG